MDASDVQHAHVYTDARMAWRLSEHLSPRLTAADYNVKICKLSLPSRMDSIIRNVFVELQY